MLKFNSAWINVTVLFNLSVALLMHIHVSLFVCINMSTYHFNISVEKWKMYALTWLAFLHAPSSNQGNIQTVFAEM